VETAFCIVNSSCPEQVALFEDSETEKQTSAAKAAFHRTLCGTAEAVPFPSLRPYPSRFTTVPFPFYDRALRVFISVPVPCYSAPMGCSPSASSGIGVQPRDELIQNTQ
jgi:hypothetical protein